MRIGYWKLVLLVLFATLLHSRLAPSAGQVRVEGKNITIEFNAMMHSRVMARFEGKEIRLGDFAPSKSVRVAGSVIADFPLKNQKWEESNTNLGPGRRVVLVQSPSLHANRRGSSGTSGRSGKATTRQTKNSEAN